MSDATRPTATRLAVFVPNWVGDAVMATPALRALRHHHAAGQLLGIMRPVVADTLAGGDWFDETILFDPRAPQRELTSPAVLARLRAWRPDTVALLTHSFRTGWMAWRSGARRRVGLALHARGWLLTDRLPPVRRGGRLVPAPVLDDYLRVAATLGCVAPRAPLELATLPEDEAQADAVWQRLRLPRDAAVVVLNSSGAFGAAKLWPREYAAALAFRLAAERAVSVLVLCGPAEREQARDIVARAAHPRVVSLADEPLSIGLSKACVRRSALLVTTDSGPRHFAAAFDVPVVTLFGPTHPAWSETFYPRATHLQHAVPCGPCQQRNCPLAHHQCLTQLGVDTVYRAAVAALETPRKTQAA